MSTRPHLRPPLKIDIERAQAHTRSAMEAARYMNISYRTYRKYAVLYGIHKTNQFARGIPRNRDKMPFSLKRILAGEYPDYEHRRLKERIVRAGILPNECSLCGFSGSRPDGKVPLILYNKDGVRTNLNIENLELRCFNCVYLTTGKYVERTVEKMGSHYYEEDFKEQITLSDREIAELQEEALQELPDREE